MKTHRNMGGHWGLWLALTLVTGFASGQPAPPPLTIGVAMPQGQLGGSSAISEVLRQRLTSQLQQQSVAAVALPGAGGKTPDDEARAANAGYVLYVRLGQKQGTGGMFSKVASLARSLPLGGFGGRGGAGALAGAAMQGAATASAVSPGSMPGAPPDAAAFAGIKRGDTITLDYRLVPVGATTPARADTVSTQAAADGQDVIGPLVSQLAGAVAPLAKDTAITQTMPTGAAPSSATSSAPQSGHSSFLGGLLGRKSAPPPTAGAASMDCAKMAGTSNGFMTVDTCEKFKAGQQAYDRAASDPSAVRPGDEQMSCSQITAELQQQQIVAPDKSKAAAAQATAAQQLALVQKANAQMLKEKAEDQAVVNAASAADRATEMSTAGLVRGRALESAEKGIQERHRASNEKLTDEARPIATTQYSQLADMGADMAAQLQSNPRLARLLQLANTKRCKGTSSW